MELRRIRVSVTAHAVRRMRERFPDVPRSDSSRTIEADVCRAIIAGRKAKSLPRWAVPADSNRRKSRGRRQTVRFVWTSDEARCYVILPATAPDGFNEAWLVMTTLKRTEARCSTN